VKGGGSGASSMKRCLRHGGEERRRAASAMWRGRDGGAFYRLEEAVEGTGDVGSPMVRSGD
jgi:hypothetical protein